MSQTPRNVLLLAPTTPSEVVERAVGSGASLDGWNVLSVSYGDEGGNGSPREPWPSRLEGAPANVGSIAVGCEGAPRGRSVPVSGAGKGVTTTVRDPTALAELVVTVGLYLDEWRAGRTLVCVHSLERLVSAVGLESTLGFLAVLTTRLDGADAVGRFSLDPTALDDRIVRGLEPAFDDVRGTELDGGSPSVSPDVAFDVLRSSRRRRLLRDLRRRAGPTTVDDLVRGMDGDASDGPERIEASLHHTHLPKLEDAGLIARNGDRIVPRPVIDSLVPYLDLALDDESSG